MSLALRVISLLCMYSLAGLVFAEEKGKEFGIAIKSVAELPEHVPTKEHVLSLFADYDHLSASGRIPVYLINRTKAAISFYAQEGAGVYCKLECQDEAGNWVRAQPHAFSFCGLSYHRMVIEPEHFLEVRSYQPAQGARRTVRYKLYRQKVPLVSNSGPGLVNEQDLHRAANDALAVMEGSFKLVSGVALGTIVLKNEMDHISDLQKLAFRQLGTGKYNTSQSRAVLREAKEKFPERTKEIDGALHELEQAVAKQIEG